MIAGHFAFTYGAAQSWLVLLVIMFVGGLFSLGLLQSSPPGQNALGDSGPLRRHSSSSSRSLIRPDDEASGPAVAKVDIADVTPVIEQRCAVCHSLTPTQPGFSSPPAGVVLETPAQLAARADDIRRVVSSQATPLGNVTGMTSEERSLVVAWVDQGASTAG